MSVTIEWLDRVRLAVTVLLGNLQLLVAPEQPLPALNRKQLCDSQICQEDTFIFHGRADLNCQGCSLQTCVERAQRPTLQATARSQGLFREASQDDCTSFDAGPGLSRASYPERGVRAEVLV